MAKVFIEETTLTAIGDAIRGKTGKTDLIDPANMSTEIAGIEAGGGPDIPDVVLTGDCSYACAGAIAALMMENFPEKITAKDITNAEAMFRGSTLETINLDIPLKGYAVIMTNFCQNAANLREFNGVISLSNGGTGFGSFGSIFDGCNRLEKLPTMLDMRPMDFNYTFRGCHRLRAIPDDFFSTWTFGCYTSSWYTLSGTFQYCYSLRKLPTSFSETYPSGETTDAHTSVYSSLYSNFAENCAVLEEIVDLPVVGTYTSSAFTATVSRCFRLSRFTFKLNNGVPFTRNWKSQVLDFTDYVGYVIEYGGYTDRITNYNSGITMQKRVTDDASYQALKNDPDWFTDKLEYSRYNHDSAVETINSLPDTSAYGTNTIKFKGEAGSKTDGGAINTLTEEEIAVATAKGWTVSFV